MEVDTEDERKEEEIEPFEDNHNDGVSDIDSDHLEEQLSYSIQLDVIALYLRSLCHELIMQVSIS